MLATAFAFAASTPAPSQSTKPIASPPTQVPNEEAILVRNTPYKSRTDESKAVLNEIEAKKRIEDLKAIVARLKVSLSK
jgi:hypothetical protein